VRQLVKPSIVFYASSIITAIAGILRALCFAALGPLFRFDVGIQPNHKLVTSGPYAVVRHPAYIACLLSHVGGFGVLAAKGAYTRECVVHDWRHTNIPVVSWLAMTLFVVFTVNSTITGYHLVKRTGWEEDVLRRQFGKEWGEYTERVRYKMIPGLI
jgi:protein-S-isoprenylcysteine O-methyltransferase Ste14